ncbi:MAG: isocitrate lyase/PEP mutase family protein [Sphingorhabdus sp.]
MMRAIDQFAALHIPGDPLILFNIWDPGSAKAVAATGAKAITTGSWGVACAAGFSDGEKLPLDFAIDNLRRIKLVTDLPVTIDMEAGYGATEAEVGQSVMRASQAGAVGINLEDKDPATRKLFPTEMAARRIAAAAASGLFVNARADQFILKPTADHDAALVDNVIERAKAYADAGAGGLFTPFLRDETLIARLCERSPLPVNILIGEGVPGHRRLAELGVARISHGHGPWAAAMDWLAAEARKIYAG